MDRSVAVGEGPAAATIIRGRTALDATLHLTTDISDVTRSLPPDGLLLAPSTMRADDPAVAALRAAVPAAAVAVPRRLARYRRVTIDSPGTTLGEIRLPEPLLAAATLACVVDLDQLPTSGPFALDLLARFVAPLDRLRLLTARGRSARVAEVNLARRFDRVIVVVTAGGQRIWLVTNDVLTGELAALALSERWLPASRERVNPWEDEVVQRATELSLGARYPGDIRVTVGATGDGSGMAETLSALQLRMGIDF